MMFQRKKLIFLCVVSIISIAFYLQMSFNDDFIKKNDVVKVESAKDIINSSGPAYVEGGSSFGGNDFFSQAKLEREINQGRSKDLVKDILENVNVNPEIKQGAIEKVNRMAVILENESKIETLVKEKGYKDVFAAIAEDGSVDLIVKTPSLTGIEVANLAEIASRHANTPMNKVHIKNKN